MELLHSRMNEICFLSSNQLQHSTKKKPAPLHKHNMNMILVIHPTDQNYN